MPEISRRDVLAGAAAAMAASALPTADFSTSSGSISALDLEALEFEDTPVWARAVLSAFLNAGGERSEFGSSFPHLLPLLDAE